MCVFVRADYKSYATEHPIEKSGVSIPAEGGRVWQRKSYSLANCRLDQGCCAAALPKPFLSQIISSCWSWQQQFATLNHYKRTYIKIYPTVSKYILYTYLYTYWENLAPISYLVPWHKTLTQISHKILNVWVNQVFGMPYQALFWGVLTNLPPV